MIIKIILAIFFLFLLIWFVSLGVYAYHVNSYGLPHDATKKSLWVLLGLAAAALLFVTYVMSGIDWRALW